MGTLRDACPHKVRGLSLEEGGAANLNFTLHYKIDKTFKVFPSTVMTVQQNLDWQCFQKWL